MVKKGGKERGKKREEEGGERMQISWLVTSLTVLSSTDCAISFSKSSVSSWPLVWVSRGTVFHVLCSSSCFQVASPWGTVRPLYAGDSEDEIELQRTSESARIHFNPVYKTLNSYLSFEVNYLPANSCPLPATLSSSYSSFSSPSLSPFLSPSPCSCLLCLIT